MRSGDGTTFRFWLVIKKRLKEKKGKRRAREGQEKMGIFDVCHKCGTLVHKTRHERCSRGIQKALAHREQLQISRANPCPHMQPKPCDQSLYVLSLYDRVQPVVYGGAKNEQYDRDQAETTCQNKYYS